MGILYYGQVRIIARRTLREFFEKYQDSEGPLEAWYAEARKADWKSPAQIKEQYRNASFLKDNRVIFNIGGNKYRLIVKIQYDFGIIFIRFIGTHGQYDQIDAEKI